MDHKLFTKVISALSLYSSLSYAGPEQAPMAVWVNEAIVATYSYSYNNFMQDQKQIAKYFSAAGWMAYSKALNESKLPESIQKNRYMVTAVATQPPQITTISPTHWQADMNLLVVYQNPEYQQQQNLKVSIDFNKAPAGQGVRGYSINSLRSVVTKPPCHCPAETNPELPTNVGSATQ